MDSEQKPEAGIFVEEVYHYDVDLGAIPVVSQQKATGSIRVQIPYDGKLLKDLSPINDEIQLGTLDVYYPDNGEIREKLSIKIPVPANDLQTLLKSPKVSVTRADYSIENLPDTLFTIDGEVIDVDEDLSNLVIGDFDAFQNALKLITSLWFPDLWTKKDDDRILELENMLLRRQDQSQIFLLFVNRSQLQEELAKSLAALANTEGGFIFIGINEQREVIGIPRRIETEYIDQCILDAALRCDPHVHFVHPCHIDLNTGKRVTYVKVPASVTTKHKLDDSYYYRKADKIISEKVHAFTLPPNLVNSIEQGKKILDRSIGEKFHPLDDIEIDLRRKNRFQNSKIVQTICGLINTNQMDTRIVVKNFALPAEDSWGLESIRYRREIQHQVEEYLEQELRKVLPELPTPKLEVIEIEDELMAVIQIRNVNSPIALYNGAAYTWFEEEGLKKIEFDQIFEQYLNAPIILPTVKDSKHPISLQYAKFNWPIQPPPSAKQTYRSHASTGEYEIQHRAVVWDSTPFVEAGKQKVQVDGYIHKLSLPLRQILLDLDENKDVVTKSPDINGEIVIRLHDVLPSGLSIEPDNEDKNIEVQRTASSILSNLSVIKQTDLHLNLQIRLKELFERRKKTSVINFRVLDVDLTEQRKIDLLHVCADLGFRANLSHKPYSDDSLQSKTALIEGIRSKGFYDIYLALGVKCENMPIKRELRFEEKRIDSRDTSTAILDVQLALQGTGPNVAEEIAQLQMRFYETISKRFHHLRTE